MKIILLEKINKIGHAGYITNVKNGYAKNYILPNKKGILATTKNITKFKSDVSINLNNEFKQEIKNNQKLNNLNILIPVSVKKNEEIYGSFNLTRLSKIIKKLELKLNIKNVEAKILIKKIGNYKIDFKNKKINSTTEIYISLLKANK
ncbi:MAG TPA: 50S ribosomal protein L9 [Candidatus Azoamicus sp. MARI]